MDPKEFTKTLKLMAKVLNELAVLQKEYPTEDDIPEELQKKIVNQLATIDKHIGSMKGCLNEAESNALDEAFTNSPERPSLKYFTDVIFPLMADLDAVHGTGEFDPEEYAA